MDKNRLYLYVKYLAVFGIILAIYLLYEQITQPVWTPCYVNSTVNCDAIISGEVSKTLGIPTPIYGLLGYIVILYATLKKKAKLLLGTATFGLLFCAYIGVKELVYLRVLCPVCILCQIDMLSTFALAYLINRKKLETE